MPTPNKTKATKPAGRAQRTPSRVPRRATATPTTRRSPRGGSSSSTSQSLIGRVQSGLPGRKRNAKPNGMQRVTGALGSVASKAPTNVPGKAGIMGMLAGGVGVAAAVARRRSSKQEESPAAEQTVPYAPPVEVLDAPPVETGDSAGPTTPE